MALKYTISHNGHTEQSTTDVESVNLVNGSSTDSITSAGTRTLHCGGKYMPNKLYIGEFELNCAGKIMAQDVDIVVENSAYPITYVLTNCTIDNAPTSISPDSTVGFYPVANTGYELPSEITVTNATYDWVTIVGLQYIRLSNPTGAVTVTITAEKPVGETWYFNSDINYSTSITFNVTFVSDGVTYNSIDRLVSAVTNRLLYDSTFVWRVRGGWVSNNYRTIILSTPATGDLLTWLQANATKQ